LKTNSFDGDIDMICIVPDTFTREKHFYGLLAQVLKNNPNVNEFFPIRKYIEI
jgi:poly(A) polymerase Pap1